MTSRVAFFAGVLGLLCGGISLPSQTSAQHGPGITTPTRFAPFRADRAPCRAPTDLQRRLIFAQDNQREFMQGVARGLAAAAKDRGVEFGVAVADNDATAMMQGLERTFAEDVGALVIAPVNATLAAPVLQKLIGKGAYVGSIVPPPATSILNAPQYLTGKVLADAAVAYIRQSLGGKAKVALLTHDSLQFLSPRFTAMRDALRTLPDADIVADISPVTVDKAGGAATMRTILLAHDGIDVVMGADTVVLGALAALREAGKARADQFLGGIDGEPEAVAEIRKGGPYRASVSLASPIFGYAMGQHAADWLDGKHVPQGMDILPKALTAANLAQYEADIADPRAVYADPARRSAYLQMYGNICYDARDQYVNFPWSSERN
jgi:ribose transport system substrate-binding protein